MSKTTIFASTDLASILILPLLVYIGADSILVAGYSVILLPITLRWLMIFVFWLDKKKLRGKE
jgi:hypothetical protein